MESEPRPQQLVKKEPESNETLHDPDALFKALRLKLSKFLDADSLVKIDEAYQFAAQKHHGQVRASGEPYIIHPIAVADILASIQPDSASVIAALLHDVVEDTDTKLEDIEKLFGESVAQLVDGLTKIGKIKFRSKQEKLAENFRKMVLAMASDLRVILVKLADRLHNLRTLQHLSPEKRLRVAQETLDIYAPLANRLGIYGIKSEMEDLCLRETKWEMYQEIKEKVSQKKTERQAYIHDVVAILEGELLRYGFKNARVYGRPKHFYSIYKKMVHRRLRFEDIHDLFAFRIIVNTVKDCYEALGIVHAMWKPMPGRFKDYIAMPKANLYQSLHTTVIRPSGEPAEIQIRTRDMQKVCEYGVAAHWAYKDSNNSGEDISPTDLKKFSWLRQIMEWQSELTDPDEFLEAVKVDLFQEEIFVFTPKGDVFRLPTAATPIDFAFAVHTDVGLTTVGAKVNGRMISIKKPLKSGDIVEILTSAHQRPSKDWLNFVTTSKARNKIRSHLRSQQRDRSKQLGRQLLEQELSARDMTLERLEKTGEVNAIAKACKESNLDDVLIALGYGRLDAKEILTRAFPRPKASSALLLPKDAAALRQQEERAARPATSGKCPGVLVSGMDNVLVTFARCCNPLPGEPITGYITRGRGVTIHREGCPRSLDMDPHRKIDIQWSSGESVQQGRRLSYIKVVSHNKTGVLADVTNIISKSGADIQKAQISVNKDMVGILEFELLVRDLDQLKMMIQKIESIPEIISVERRSAIRSKS